MQARPTVRSPALLIVMAAATAATGISMLDQLPTATRTFINDLHKRDTEKYSAVAGSAWTAADDAWLVVRHRVS